MNDQACETPLSDHVAEAVNMMERGTRMVLDEIANDPSRQSSSFGPAVSCEIAKQLSAHADLMREVREVVGTLERDLTSEALSAGNRVLLALDRVRALLSKLGEA